jgi:hypothetical protein
MKQGRPRGDLGRPRTQKSRGDLGKGATKGHQAGATSFVNDSANGALGALEDYKSSSSSSISNGAHTGARVGAYREKAAQVAPNAPNVSIVPFNRQGQQVERGDPTGVHWGYATPPKHRGACLAGCGCDREGRPTVYIGLPETFEAAKRLLNCAVQQNIAPEAPGSPVVETLPAPGTRGGVKRKTRGRGK